MLSGPPLGRNQRNQRRGVQEAVAARHQQNGKDEDEEDGEEEEDAWEDLGVEVDVLLAASGRCPRFSAGTLQRGIPIPRCCL